MVSPSFMMSPSLSMNAVTPHPTLTLQSTIRPVITNRNNSVGIATRYLDGSGFEPRWKQEIFSSPNPSRPTQEPTQRPVKTVLVFWGVNRPRLGADHHRLPSADIKTGGDVAVGPCGL